ncbi:aminotransferase class V-fold PLP-dependent enzyme [Sphaerisporangium fuscum]|uniref:aminotransferase class V-fold PLP-dependent enzyme n=1 Tax=Sphaerisporangium fuscum TaxID=2835868 RepID=UPI001BDC2AED|nr:aminotransferase class V-fold PLP-dependent enzyme [Sphaerisporangium fuscum]
MNTDIEDEVTRWRAETPGCRNVVHLNNAGSSLPPSPVLDAVTRHLRLEAEYGGYEAADAAAGALEQVYASIGTLIGADAAEVALVENATRAWDMAFYSIPFAPGDRVLTCVSEYASNYLAFLQLRDSRGVEIVVVPDDDAGEIDLDALARAASHERTRLIAITHIPTNGGVVNPAAEVGRIARENGVLYLLDACQSVGQLEVDVDAIGCDFLSATGRKFLRGPRGTGFLYARAATTADLHPPLIDLHAATWVTRDSYELRPDARRFENWESYVAGRLGLGAAADYALAIGLDRIETRVVALAARLRAMLTEIPGITVYDKGRRPSGIVTFAHDRLRAQRISGRLREQRVNTSYAKASSTRLDHERRGLPELVRASVHYFTTDGELEELTRALRKMIDEDS